MKILFSSNHNYLDVGSGAAVTTREELLELVRRGHKARTLCGALFDGVRFGEEELVKTLSRMGIPAQRSLTTAEVGGARLTFKLYRFDDSGIDSTVFIPLDESGRETNWNHAAEKVFLALLEEQFDEFSPEILASYGGQRTVSASAMKAKRRGIKSVFMLHNLSYRDPKLFKNFDMIVVPSEYVRKRYRERLGLDARVLAPLIDPAKVVATERTPRFLAFVTPTAEKGLYFFIGIARELGERRPDIPILLVEGRGKVQRLSTIPEARKLTNLNVLERVESPALFFKETRLLVVPSLCEETFGRVVVEAGMNGIPALCSDRGALPEVVGDRNLVLPIPQRFTPATRAIPTPEETEDWLAALVALWDDSKRAERFGVQLRKRVQRYAKDDVANRLETLLNELY